MGAFIIDGRIVETPFPVRNYKDTPALALTPGEDCRPRSTRWIRNITLHTTICFPTVIVPGAGPDRNVEERVAKWWRKDGRMAGADMTIDYDGSVGQHCDLVRDASRNAGALNDRTIGIEIAKLWEGPKGGVYEVQISRAVEVVEWLCRFFGIQRQCVDPGMYKKLIPRIVAGGKDVVGVVGHQHQKVNKYGGQAKPNDPGPQVFQALVDAGFLPWTFTENNGYYDDLEFWKPWQHELGVPIDGVPGRTTTNALEDAGHKDGLLVLPDPR